MAPEIEFVESGDEPAPQDEAVPAARSPRTRWRWLLVAAAVVIAGGSFALTRPSGTPRAAPASSASASSVVPDQPGGPPSSVAARSRCGGSPFCAVTLVVPAEVTAALRTVVPRPTGLRVETSVAQGLASGGSYLAERVIYLSNATTRLRITVHRLIGAVPSLEAVAIGVVQVRVRTEAFVIDVLCYPTNHAGPTERQLRSLARDPRLAVL